MLEGPVFLTFFLQRKQLSETHNTGSLVITTAEARQSGLLTPSSPGPLRATLGPTPYVGISPRAQEAKLSDGKFKPGLKYN